jgi:protein involved in polysaccharide export with SLBB domain
MHVSLFGPSRRRLGWGHRAGALVMALAGSACWAQASGPLVGPVTPLPATRPAAPAMAPTPAPHAAAATAPSREAAPPPVREPGTAAPETLVQDPFERLATEAHEGRPVWRFGRQMRRLEGAEARDGRGGAGEAPARVPADYVVQVGDELTVAAWGSVEAEWRLRVDRAGRVTLPRVGPVAVAGARAAELEALFKARLERVFRGFELAAAVTEVSPVRLRITGFVERPGEYVVPGLSTISSALVQAQGPAAGGSYRRIQLLRGGRVEARFDLYALLGRGTRAEDRLLQPDDVLHVEAALPQAALVGAVNRPAVFEFAPGATVGDLLELAGGLAPLADRERLLLERVGDRGGLGAVELQLPRDLGVALGDGDLLRAVSRVGPSAPSQLRNKRVRIEGEVMRPGDYLLPPTATLADALQAAGGAADAAWLFGTELRRERARLAQEAHPERALQGMEAEANRIALAQAGNEDGRRSATETVTRQLLTRLRARRPEGRIVLDVTPDAQALPPMALEDGDQIRVPPRTQSVGVFGSVVNTGHFVHSTERTLGQYLQRAGGATPAADAAGAFVVRANGSVVSAREGGFWTGLARFEAQPALPGDTIFVPEKLDRITFTQGAKDWTQILYQFGIGVAALLALR